jgi:hypothetical protein
MILSHYVTETNALISIEDYSCLSDDHKERCTPVYVEEFDKPMKTPEWWNDLYTDASGNCFSDADQGL